MKAIDTMYKGYRFRSRLEARWAVFFDSLGVAYDYEPEGFDLGEGVYYLPDFWLPLQKAWIEIKPTSEAIEWDKMDRFARGLGYYGDVPPSAELWVVVGTPESPPPHHGNYEDSRHFILGDCHYMFCVCPVCGRVGFEFDGRSERIPCSCRVNEKFYTQDHPRLIAAYAAARAARFEFNR